MSYEALALRCAEPALTARVGQDCYAAPPSASVGARTPIRPAPMVVSSTDFDEYERELTALSGSFIDDDLTKNIVWLDPDKEAKLSAEYCAKAKIVDACEPCFECKGWGEEINPALGDLDARRYRQLAFRHSENSLWLQVRASQLKLSEEAKTAHIALGSATSDWQRRYSKFLAGRTYTVVFDSDFRELQKFDLELQALRDEYTALSGRAPTRALPERLPPPNVPGANEIPQIVGPIVKAALVLGGVFVAVTLVSKWQPAERRPAAPAAG